MARIKAILRRSGAARRRAAAGDRRSRAPHRIYGRALDLTPTEYGILAALARRPGQVFSRASCSTAAREGNANMDVADRAIDSHVKNLRRKLGEALPGVEAIRAIYGLGYRFDCDPRFMTAAHKSSFFLHIRAASWPHAPNLRRTP
jgi:two-component system response regulator BaeR